MSGRNEEKENQPTLDNSSVATKITEETPTCCDQLNEKSMVTVVSPRTVFWKKLETPTLPKKNSLLDLINKNESQSGVNSVKGILKGSNKSASAVLVCEYPSADFMTRNLCLFRNHEVNIGRLTKAGGELPDEVYVIL